MKIKNILFIILPALFVVLTSYSGCKKTNIKPIGLQTVVYSLSGGCVWNYQLPMDNLPHQGVSIFNSYQDLVPLITCNGNSPTQAQIQPPIDFNKYSVVFAYASPTAINAQINYSFNQVDSTNYTLNVDIDNNVNTGSTESTRMNLALLVQKLPANATVTLNITRK